MKVTILWEDRRGTQVRGFGPHELLLRCVADECGKDVDDLRRTVIGEPKKGNGGILRDLKRNRTRLEKAGPVVVVLDRDKAHEIWDQAAPNCMSGIREKLKRDAPGNYELLFLVDNIESLLQAVSRALGLPDLENKPNPNGRDRLLMRAVWDTEKTRRRVREEIPSFHRLVAKVVQALGESVQSPP